MECCVRDCVLTHQACRMLVSLHFVMPYLCCCEALIARYVVCVVDTAVCTCSAVALQACIRA